MTPDVTSAIARDEVQTTIAKIRSHLQLDQAKQADFECGRCVQFLEQLRGTGVAEGDLQFLIGTVQSEAGRLDDSLNAFASVMQKDVPVCREELRELAVGHILKLRQRLVARNPGQVEGSHFSSFYVCTHCGHFRLFLSAPCEVCLNRPRDETDVAAGFMASTDNGLAQGLRGLHGISRDILSGIPFSSHKNFGRAVANVMREPWFGEYSKKILKSDDARSTRLSEYTTCRQCSKPLQASAMTECDCGASITLEPKQRLLVCLHLLVGMLEDRWIYGGNAWALQEFVATLVVARYELLVIRTLPPPEIRGYMLALPGRIEALGFRDSKGELGGCINFDPQGNPSGYGTGDNVGDDFYREAKSLVQEMRSLNTFFEHAGALTG
jgi:hypothetical protein